MKKLLLAVLAILTIIPLTGCFNVNVLFAAAQAGLVAYEAGYDDSDPQYQAAEKVGQDLADLSTLYSDAEKAVGGAQLTLNQKIADAAQVLIKDNKAWLDLVAIKSPSEKARVSLIVAAGEAFLYAAVNAHPDPSGTIPQLNSTAAQLKAAGLPANMMTGK